MPAGSASSSRARPHLSLSMRLCALGFESGRPYFTTSVKKLFKVCGGPPFNDVVNDNVYVPAGVAPFGPCGKLLLQAANPNPTSSNVANVIATLRFRLNIHTAPPKTIETSNNPIPPPCPPNGAIFPVAVP